MAETTEGQRREAKPGMEDWKQLQETLVRIGMAADIVSHPAPPVIGVVRHEHRNADERKDSIELGPAHARVKVYIDMTKPEAKALVDLAIETSRYAAEELLRLGLLKGAQK